MTDPKKPTQDTIERLKRSDHNRGGGHIEVNNSRPGTDAKVNNIELGQPQRAPLTAAPPKKVPVAK